MPHLVKGYLAGVQNYYLSDYDLSYFSDSLEKVGSWALNDFYSYLEIAPKQVTNLTRDALQFYLGDNIRAYVYVDTPSNLLQYCYVSRRKKNEKGYQRIVEKGRIGNLANRINTGNILAFPNSILISCSNESTICDNPKDKCDTPAPVKIKVPNHFCACRIIDGQHRLLGFAKANNATQSAHAMPVVLLEGIDLKDEMSTFIDINSGQRKIDKNLILVLQADFQWDKSKNEKEYFENY
jgi:DGQHR domain-containing protein